MSGPRLDSVESYFFSLLFFLFFPSLFQLDFSPGMNLISGRAQLFFLSYSPPSFISPFHTSFPPPFLSSNFFLPFSPACLPSFFSFSYSFSCSFPIPLILFSWFLPPFPISICLPFSPLNHFLLFYLFNGSCYK